MALDYRLILPTYGRTRAAGDPATVAPPNPSSMTALAQSAAAQADAVRAMQQASAQSGVGQIAPVGLPAGMGRVFVRGLGDDVATITGSNGATIPLAVMNGIGFATAAPGTYTVEAHHEGYGSLGGAQNGTIGSMITRVQSRRRGGTVTVVAGHNTTYELAPYVGSDDAQNPLGAALGVSPANASAAHLVSDAVDQYAASVTPTMQTNPVVLPSLADLRTAAQTPVANTNAGKVFVGAFVGGIVVGYFAAKV